MSLFSRIFPALLGCYLWSGVAAGGADVFVNNVSGDDHANGLSKTANSGDGNGPVRTIARAVELAGPGDTIHLENTAEPYREEISLRAKGGEPGRPITVDGHGVVLDGSEPCQADAWKEIHPGLWRLAGTYSRNALIVDDRLSEERQIASEIEPGSFAFENTQFEKDVLFIKLPKGRKVTQVAVKVFWPDGESLELDPKKWKIGSLTRYRLPRAERPQRVLLDGVEAAFPAAKDRLKPGEWCMDGGDLYFSPPTGKTPAELKIDRVVRGTGVSLSGTVAHIVIKNLNVRYVWNDAYNIHGKVTDAYFFNCNARDCFDEGFSAHDRTETVLDGAVFERCDNGVFNVNEGGWSVTKNLTVRDSRHYGFGVANVESEARHWLTDAVLENNPVPLFGRYLEVENVAIRSDAPARCVISAPFVLAQATIDGVANSFEIVPGDGSIQLKRSIFRASQTQDVVFAKQADVFLESIFFSPQTQVVTKTGALPITVAEWMGKLGAAVSDSGLVEAGAEMPKELGFQKK